MFAFTRLEWMLARRYLGARHGFISLTTWFAIIGITLGVATLILVTSLMNGIRSEMAAQFIGLDGHITVQSTARAFSDYSQSAQAIRTVPGVAAVTPKIIGQVMATAHGVALGAQAMAMPWTALESRERITAHVTSGSLMGIRDENGIVLGERLARNLKVSVGDGVTLISPQGRATIAGFIPRMKTYTVTGTVKLGMHALDSGLILMPFTEAQQYFLLATPEGDGAVSNLEITAKDAASAAFLARELRARLGHDTLVYDWQQSNASIFAALKVQRNVMVIILALIVLVAAFNIISSLVMLVKEKRRSIAVLRTMGATRMSVMRVFIAAGTSIGVVGTLSGVILGLMLAANLEQIHQAIEKLLGQELLVENIYFLSSLPTETDPREVMVIMVLALLLSVLATIYPASHAAKLDPAEALRDE